VSILGKKYRVVVVLGDGNYITYHKNLEAALSTMNQNLLGGTVLVQEMKWDQSDWPYWDTVSGVYEGGKYGDCSISG